MLAAWQGREQEASGLIRASAQMAAQRGKGMMADFAWCASAVLDNGLAGTTPPGTPPGRCSRAITR
jgi:hypothetical protein